MALFEQEPVFDEDKSVLDNIFFHNHPVINAIKEFEMIDENSDPVKLNAAIIKMDDLGAWDFDAKVKQILGKLNIHHLEQPVKSLSGGQRKRVALAKTLIDIGFEHKHVLLIMDEPTNHLDVEMVEWLEHYLNKENVTLLHGYPRSLFPRCRLRRDLGDGRQQPVCTQRRLSELFRKESSPYRKRSSQYR